VVESSVKIHLDLDKTRILEIVSEACDYTKLALSADLLKDKETVLKDINNLLSSNRVSQTIFYKVGSKSAPDLEFRIDLRKRKIFAISSFKKKQARVNNYLGAL
jgi:predicted HTH transcriptional regulator